MNNIRERMIGYAREWRELQHQQIEWEYPTFASYVEEQEAQLEARLAKDQIEHLREFDP